MNILVLIHVLLPLTAWLQEGQKPEKVEQNLKVQVQRTGLREHPMFFAKVIADLKEGDAVTSFEMSGAWHHVRIKGKTGWVHKSALTRRQRLKIAVEDDGKEAADPGRAESYAAAKGFNEEMEREYKKEKNLEPNYEQVDWIEKYPVYLSDRVKLDGMLRQFRQEGKLGG